jgi:hypothetical protein
MKRIGLVVTLFMIATRASAQTGGTAIHIQPTGDGFENYLAAAMAKKHVPAALVDRADRATLTLKSSALQVRKDAASTKVMKCMLADCEGIDGRASASVKLVDRDGTIVWSYSVTGDQDDKDRIAEAIAKHLKSDYFGGKASPR